MRRPRKLTTDQEALRKAASCISELLVSTLCTPSSLPGFQPRAMYVWEEAAIEFLREQWERDPGTQINDWTAQIVRGDLTPTYQGWVRRPPLPANPNSGI